MPAAEPERDWDAEQAAEDIGYEDSYASGSCSPPYIDPYLEDAIKIAPAAKLRDILIRVCRQDDFAREYATGILLAPTENGSGRKRKRYEWCRNCDEDYNVLDNTVESCVIHTGNSRNNLSPVRSSCTNPRCVGREGLLQR